MATSQSTKTKQRGYKVRLQRPGILRCGNYQANRDYTIEDPREALRLVRAKGFTAIGWQPESVEGEMKKQTTDKQTHKAEA